MKKLTALLLVLLLSTGAFSQQSDSVIVKMSVQDYNLWNSYAFRQFKLTGDNLDAISKIVVAMRDNLKSFDTSLSFITSRATLTRDSAKKQ